MSFFNKALLLALGFFAGCATASSHSHADLWQRIEALEARTEVWTDPHLIDWIKADPHLRWLRAQTQCLQFAHPEIDHEACKEVQ